MTDARVLAQAARTYDASGVKVPSRLASVLPRATAEPDHDTEPRDDEVKRARVRLWNKIPSAYRAKQADLVARIPHPELVRAATSWNWGSPCLLVCGPADAGKSTAAALILLRLMAKGRESEFRRWSSIQWFGANTLTGASRGWSLGEGLCPEMRVASSCGLLVLDELGNEQDWQTTMFDLLQARFERELDNIVLSPLRPRELHARYGDSIVKRLIQRKGTLGTIVDLWGAS